MPIGDVIKISDEELRVITKIDNGYSYTQRLEEYISEITIIKYGDDFKTIKEVIQHCCDEYLKGKEIIDRSQSEKEVVLETYLYVSVKGKDLDKPSEEMIKEAKEKMIKALDKAGIDYQIFSGELRD